MAQIPGVEVGGVFITPEFVLVDVGGGDERGVGASFIVKHVLVLQLDARVLWADVVAVGLCVVVAAVAEHACGSGVREAYGCACVASGSCHGYWN